VIEANRPGWCLCGLAIEPGQPIVKRWRAWIHVACYDVALASPQATRGRETADIRAAVRRIERTG
jgi:hypothetical protein